MSHAENYCNRGSNRDAPKKRRKKKKKERKEFARLYALNQIPSHAALSDLRDFMRARVSARVCVRQGETGRQTQREKHKKRDRWTGSRERERGGGQRQADRHRR